MSADMVDAYRYLLCLPGHCTLSLVGGGAVLADGPEAKFSEICNGDVETLSSQLTQSIGRGRLFFGVLPTHSPW